MPKYTDIHKVLVLGSGPIVIGQAAEFDYAGTQACTALKQEGCQVVLINSNPATIMTDKTMADQIYIEPLDVETVKRIILKEKPDSVLATLGGQTGLNLGMALSEDGFLQQHGIRLLGADPATIKKAEDRQAFKDTMEQIGEPCIASKVVEDVESAVEFAQSIDYPVVVRPAYTLGGTGGGFCHTEAELREICENGLRASMIHQVLIEKCIAGWKEIEYEVVRDAMGNCITVCSMENIDPVGIHTGDSIVVAPAQTMLATESAMLRCAALNIVTALGVEGACNVQFALRPESMEYAVIEVNPRLSRSSALASKATGYPIAKVATKIALGYHLDEIVNAVTGTTYACNEPAVDYCVLKFPKWPFDKFVYGKRTLGTQMKATGEVMSIGVNFEQAFMKAVRSIELKLDTPNLPKFEDMTAEQLLKVISNNDDERIFAVYAALQKGVSADVIFDMTKIDHWFLSKFIHLNALEKELKTAPLTEELYLRAKHLGFLDKTIEEYSHQPLPVKRHAVFKTVDTCAGEFASQTPYFYSTWDEENEALEYIQNKGDEHKKIVVMGSGPIRIGQGIEFDYCCVHCVKTLKELGYDAILINNNPETVSTDFDVSDRLYFDPLTKEDVANVFATEHPYACVCQFGGQTAIKMVKHLDALGVPLLGTAAEMIDAAEDRQRFDEILEQCGIKRPAGHTVFTTEEAVKAADDLGYPVLLRPSYVLGGQNMIIAYKPDDIVEYMTLITAQSDLENPVLIDKYIMGTEVEVDAICDGKDYLIPGIMEHVERAGVHSGDSISVYPPRSLKEDIKKTIVDYTGRLAKALHVVGMMNVQYVVYHDEVYVIEVNPRSSRTVPFISKVTGVPMVDLATKCMLGQSLQSLGYGTGVFRESVYVAVKVPVFSFEKLHDVDTHLGPEMKSTGEVLGLARNFDEALFKGMVASGAKLKKSGGVFISVRDQDKAEVLEIADRFASMGFDIYATAGTANLLNRNMIAASMVRKISEPHPNIADLLESGKIDYVISTSSHGRDPQKDSVKIRRKSVERAIPCFTSLDTVKALMSCLKMDKNMADIDLVNLKEI